MLSMISPSITFSFSLANRMSGPLCPSATSSAGVGRAGGGAVEVGAADCCSGLVAELSMASARQRGARILAALLAKLINRVDEASFGIALRTRFGLLAAYPGPESSTSMIRASKFREHHDH